MLIRTGLLFVPTVDDKIRRTLHSLLKEHGIDALVVVENQAGEQRHWIAEILRRWCDEEELELILTVGGTWPAAGHSEREPVPEATLDILERPLPGLVEAMRRQAANTSRLALMDRGNVGIRGRTLVVNLPWGSESAAVFLKAIVNLIEPVVERLRGTNDGEPPRDLLRTGARGTDQVANSMYDEGPADTAATVESNVHSLDEDEFAAFLQRKRQSGSDQ